MMRVWRRRRHGTLSPFVLGMNHIIIEETLALKRETLSLQYVNLV